MNTMDLANKMAALCREGKNHEALQTLFTDDMVSVEAAAMPGMEQEAKGLAAVKAKGQWWRDNHEVHSAVVTGPWPHGETIFTVKSATAPRRIAACRWP